MFVWNEKYQFVFSDLGASDKVGVNDVGIGFFKKYRIVGTVKETTQNGLDAENPELPEGTPVKIKFELIYIDRDDIPGAERLNEVINKCYEYYPDGDDGEKLRAIRDASEKFLGKPGLVPVLKISDYNTVGLRGVTKQKGSNWSGLLRERGATNKTEGASGSFGIGKFAQYTQSSVRTVFYSTKTIDNEIGFQGKALLTTFEEDGVEKQNIGLFADTSDPKFNGVLIEEDIAPVFRREEVGTDVFVLGFEKESDWMEQTAISVLENFFYAIYKGNLEVEIVEEDKVIRINQENIGEKIKYYTEYSDEHMKDDVTFSFTAPTYWKMLNGEHKLYKEQFVYKGKNMGEYELYLLVGDDAPGKKVLEMRHAGMKIREDSAFRIQANFIGIFVATGNGAASLSEKDNISSFLRKCENPSHDDWSPEEYKEEKEMARAIINQIHAIILDAVKNEMPVFEEDSTDAFGLSEYLLNEEADDDEKEEKAFKDLRPLSFEIMSVKSGKHRLKADISMKKNGGSKRKKEDDKEEKEDKEKDEKEKKHRDNKRGNGLNKVSEVYISKIRTPYNNISDVECGGNVILVCDTICI